eukprot:COSAG01_NODE_1908_length_8929_cov_219.706195_9_plen_95_part_00
MPSTILGVVGSLRVGPALAIVEAAADAAGAAAVAVGCRTCVIRCKRSGPADLMNDRSDAFLSTDQTQFIAGRRPAHTSHRMRKVHREWTRPSGA